MASNPLGQALRPVLSLLRTLNTPRSLTISILVEAGEWDQLVTMHADPRNYLDVPSHAARFARDYQATELLRKFEGLPVSHDLDDRAVETFHVSEKQCLETNYMLEMVDISSTAESDRIRELISDARKIVHRIIGPLPDDLSGRYGPGTSFELKGSTFSTLADKMWITPHVTRSCEDLFTFLTKDDHNSRTRTRLGLPWIAYCRGNRFTTVPKDSKTNRGICIEPLGNLYCQLAIGAYFKERLERHGIFVAPSKAPRDPLASLLAKPRPTGQDLHRQMARDGSTTGRWATIDLSNASDTVSYGLVRRIIPELWFRTLSACRSPFTFLNERWVKLEKFSSMGNGYTFELETLIFLAIACAACPHLVVGKDVFVYGDDIIVPSDDAREVQAALQLVGFTLNPRKCFSQGPFRESCGGDYFLGFDVRPFYLKQEPASPSHWYTFRNYFAERYNTPLLSKVIVDRIPVAWRCWGPPTVSHTHLFTRHRDRWSWGSPKRATPWIKWIRVVVDEHLTIPLDRWGNEFTVSLALLGVQSKGLTPRGSPVGYRTSLLSVS